MVCLGKDNQYTAMSDTVGIPVGIAAKMLLNNKIKSRGVLLPISKEIYSPVLKELENYGITFIEKQL
jgi:saccharopine dehydrogenase-like NADP-dependent oxidoreductase